MREIFQKVKESDILFFNGSMYTKPKYKFNSSELEFSCDVPEKYLVSVVEDFYGDYVALVCKLGDSLVVEIPDDLIVVYS